MRRSIVSASRVSIFALTALCCIIVLGIAANFLYLTKRYLGGYFYFTPLVLSVAGFTVFSVGILYVLGFTRRTLFLSRTYFELAWMSFLCMAWFATAGYTVWSDHSFNADCHYEFDVVEDLCHQLPIISAVSFVTAVLLFAYCVILLVLGFVGQSYGLSVWSMSFKEAAIAISERQQRAMFSTPDTPLRPTVAASIPTANDTRSSASQTYPLFEKVEPLAHPYSSTYYASGSAEP